jgi:hypothetical protein
MTRTDEPLPHKRIPAAEDWEWAGLADAFCPSARKALTQAAGHFSTAMLVVGGSICTDERP